jgi:P27 family predicted phage terminase small subunit
MRNQTFKPPAHLKPATKRWFKHVCEQFELEQHHVRLLTMACEAWDRAVESREALAAKGLTYDDRFGQPHARPEVAIERDSRIAFARLTRELCLDDSTPDDRRSPGLR